MPHRGRGGQARPARSRFRESRPLDPTALDGRRPEAAVQADGRNPETTRHEASCAPEIASRRRWSSWSDLGHAAIDDQFDAGDIATFV
ncbi:MAG: hypothetical protein WB799_05670, partial [Candidatus Sulfotelmatobacter sp.]